MRQPRTADDKVLALFARVPLPISAADVSAALNWSRQRAAEILGRLVKLKSIVELPGARNSEKRGRTPALFTVPGAPLPPRAPRPPVPEFAPDTYVVVPSGYEARVIGMVGRSYAEFEYITGPEKFQRGTLHISLLRPFQPGRARPEPVRLP
jgi:hypothetical protein